MYEKLVSVIIVTYNSSNDIYDCLDSLVKNNDIGNSLEVIIVDNNSEDREEMLEIVKLFSNKNIHILFNNRNGGYGQGNNIGVETATSPVILIMNPDVRLFCPIFKNALTHFSDENMGILGMQQCEQKEVIRQSFLPLQPSIRGLLLYKIYTWIHKYSPRYFCIHGACFFIRKKALEEIGKFDENIFLYNEEIDIHYRLLRQGKYSIKYENTLFYIHPMHSRPETLKELQQRFITYMYVCKKMSLNQHKALCKYINLYRLHFLRSLLKRNNTNKNIYFTFYMYLLQQKKLLKY